MRTASIKDLLKMQPGPAELVAQGWVRTFRSNRFISLSDGSSNARLQAVVDFEKTDAGTLKKITTGAALRLTGQLVPSQGSGQKVELLVRELEVLGEADETYPIQPKEHSFEFLREQGHLRFRTGTFGSVFRIRHAVSYAIHKYFNDNGFFWIHSPIITGSDAEGAGEMFRVTTFNLNDLPKDKSGKVLDSEDFFGKQSSLTVSGQLEAELAAMGLSKVYTFGPTFRAENSNTSRHLAEFWMIEPEVAFNDLKDNMDLAENFLKYIIRYVLENCSDDVEMLSDARTARESKLKQEDRSEYTLLEQLQSVSSLNGTFERVTYTEAIDILRNSNPNKKKKFTYLIDGWGADLQSEHERYLVEKHFKKPVILTDYPKEIKAFYMRENEDGKTVRAMDILFPGIGEIIGGSQREERYEKLENRMKEMHIDTKEMWWYMETRRFGTVPHSGFGLGLERLMMFVTGMNNVRDVIPFPRTPKNAEF